MISSQNKCTVFHYDQNGLLITESTRTGNIKAEYVYLNGQPLAKIENNNIYYYHNDHLGTPMVMTNDGGNVVWSGEYLPFGEPLSITGTITNNLRFPGQYYDAETGLHQNWHRDYKPEIGRYPQADPIGIEGGMNLFIYVGNNPINYKDPLGLDRYEWCGGEDKYLCKCLTGWGCSIMPPEYCCKVDFTDCMNKARTDKEQTACAFAYVTCLAQL